MRDIETTLMLYSQGKKRITALQLTPKTAQKFILMTYLRAL